MEIELVSGWADRCARDRASLSLTEAFTEGRAQGNPGREILPIAFDLLLNGIRTPKTLARRFEVLRRGTAAWKFRWRRNWQMTPEMQTTDRKLHCFFFDPGPKTKCCSDKTLVAEIMFQFKGGVYEAKAFLYGNVRPYS